MKKNYKFEDKVNQAVDCLLINLKKKLINNFFASNIFSIYLNNNLFKLMILIFERRRTIHSLDIIKYKYIFYVNIFFKTVILTN